MNRATLLAITAATVVGIGCTNAPAQPEVEAATSYRVMHEGLCGALDSANDRRVAEAARDFEDHAHQALHLLADETASIDRSAAARLLEAKQRVEDRLEHRDRELASGIRELIAAANAALDVLDHPAATECAPEEQP